MHGEGNNDDAQVISMMANNLEFCDPNKMKHNAPSLHGKIPGSIRDVRSTMPFRSNSHWRSQDILDDFPKQDCPVDIRSSSVPAIRDDSLTNQDFPVSLDVCSAMPISSKSHWRSEIILDNFLSNQEITPPPRQIAVRSMAPMALSAASPTNHTAQNMLTRAAIASGCNSQ